jgi:salicylate hydroxylase
MKDAHILIIGAGLGGLTATLALQKAGFSVSVYEQADELGEVGAGVTITPNGCHVLDHLLDQAVMRHIFNVPPSGAIKHYRSGEIIVDTQRGDLPKRRYGANYCQAHRADLHGALVEAVIANDPHAIHLDSRFTGLEESHDTISATFANGRKVEGTVLIGADGIRSNVRDALWEQEEPKFTGYIAWRGLVPLANLENPDVIFPDSAAFAGRGRTFSRYLVRQRTLINYVAFVEREQWATESWSIRSDVAEVQEEFREFCPEVQAILAATPANQCFKWGLFDRQPLKQWTRGRASLLGDAGHPMTPFLAQGACMAIEDGMVLARAFEASGDWNEALERYEAARRERGTFVMLESHVNARRMFSRDPDNYTPEKHRTTDRLGLYEYNPLTVPI